MKQTALLLCFVFICSSSLAAERTEHFDKDPGWDGHNNRARTPEPRSIRQDFGYSGTTSHFDGKPGEVGGLITPAGEPAYYAKEIPEQTFQDSLSASGRIVCSGRVFHVLVGFFNAGTVNEWRTPNSIALRLQGRGDVFFAYVEYTTSRWRAGGDSPGGFSLVRDPQSQSGRMNLKGFATGPVVHQWSLRYDPAGNGGTGSITVTMDNETAVCHLDPGHKADGASFNRFGLLNVVKQADGGGEVWLDDITVANQTEPFDRDPHWSEFQNRRTYVSREVRPRFDFGYSSTRFAEGEGPGEMGGLVFRGDGRYTNMMAYYGDRLDELSLERPLSVSGRISLRRAVSDSDVLLGFFHSEHSLDSGGTDKVSTPPDFLGVSIGGPSREGFMVAPAYRLHNTERRSGNKGPYLYPNGKPRVWTFDYQPASPVPAEAGKGKSGGVITVTVDGERVQMEIPAEHRAMGAHYNRFGLISTHIDGNVQHIYFDDLTYTWKQEERSAAR